MIKGIFLHIYKTSGKSNKAIIDKYGHLSSAIVDNGYIWLSEDFTGKKQPISDNLILKESFKWCFVRNPFDRIISVKRAWETYNIHKSLPDLINLCKIGISMNWKGFNLQQIVKESYRYQKTDMAIIEHLTPMNILVNQFCDVGQVAFDYIGRFENINNDWQIIKNSLEIEDDLPHLNQSVNTKPYTEYYENSDWIDDVIEIYKEDFIQFEYSRSL
jgi:hypothetical protein